MLSDTSDNEIHPRVRLLEHAGDYVATFQLDLHAVIHRRLDETLWQLQMVQLVVGQQI